jgi:hypothetical protein
MNSCLSIGKITPIKLEVQQNETPKIKQEPIDETINDDKSIEATISSSSSSNKITNEEIIYLLENLEKLEENECDKVQSILEEIESTDAGRFEFLKPYIICGDAE